MKIPMPVQLSFLWMTLFRPEELYSSLAQLGFEQPRSSGAVFLSEIESFSTASIEFLKKIAAAYFTGLLVALAVALTVTLVSPSVFFQPFYSAILGSALGALIGFLWDMSRGVAATLCLGVMGALTCLWDPSFVCFLVAMIFGFFLLSIFGLAVLNRLLPNVIGDGCHQFSVCVILIGAFFIAVTTAFLVCVPLRANLVPFADELSIILTLASISLVIYPRYIDREFSRVEDHESVFSNIALTAGMCALAIEIAVGLIHGFNGNRFFSGTLAWTTIAIVFIYRVPFWVLESSIIAVLVAAGRLFRSPLLQWSPVFFHQESYVPLPLLTEHVLIVSSIDPETCMRILREGSKCPGQQQLIREALAKLQAREFCHLIESRDLVQLSTLQGKWIPLGDSSSQIHSLQQNIAQYMACLDSSVANEQKDLGDSVRQLIDELQKLVNENIIPHIRSYEKTVSLWHSLLSELESGVPHQSAEHEDSPPQYLPPSDKKIRHLGVIVELIWMVFMRPKRMSEWLVEKRITSNENDLLSVVDLTRMDRPNTQNSREFLLQFLWTCAVCFAVILIFQHVCGLLIYGATAPKLLIRNAALMLIIFGPIACFLDLRVALILAFSQGIARSVTSIAVDPFLVAGDNETAFVVGSGIQFALSIAICSVLPVAFTYSSRINYLILVPTLLAGPISLLNDRLTDQSMIVLITLQASAALKLLVVQTFVGAISSFIPRNLVWVSITSAVLAIFVAWLGDSWPLGLVFFTVYWLTFSRIVLAPIELAAYLVVRSKAKATPEVLRFSPPAVHELGISRMPHLERDIRNLVQRRPQAAKTYIHFVALNGANRESARKALNAVRIAEIIRFIRSRQIDRIADLKGDWISTSDFAEEPALKSVQNWARQMLECLQSRDPNYSIQRLDALSEKFSSMSDEFHKTPWIAVAIEVTRLHDQLKNEKRVAARARILNPFSENPGSITSRAYVDHPSAVKDIRAFFANRTDQILLLIGPRRTGKTSLLNRLPIIFPKIIFAQLDLQDLPVNQPEKSISHLASLIFHESDSDHKATNAASLPKTVKELLERLISISSTEQVVICVDEFEALQSFDRDDVHWVYELLHGLSSLHKSIPTAKLILAGANIESIMGALIPEVTEFPIVNMGALDREDAMRVLVGSDEIQSTGAIPVDVAYQIYEQTNGHPFLLQAYGYELIEKLNGEGKAKATLTDLSVIERTVAQKWMPMLSDTSSI